MRIAVISDTHGKFPDSVARELRKADEIWHLGDFCDLATYSAVLAVGPPVYAVLGNNDWSLDLPMKLVLERGGKTFLLIHIDPSRSGGTDFLLHGHTHIPRDEMVGQTRMLNPGAITRANPKTWAWLTVDEGTGAISWELQKVP